MKNSILVSLFGLLAMISRIVAAPVGTAFTYQGQLADAGQPANGLYDFRFAIYGSSAGPTQIGNNLTNAAVAVSNGLFTVTLDFGVVFDGQERWLGIGVRPNGSASDFSTLSPRQALTPSPYAVYAPTAGAAVTATTAASANSVAAANVTGTLALGQLPGAVVTNNQTGVSLHGTFSGSGTGLTSVNADLLDGQQAAFYQNAANLTAGTLPDARLSTSVALRSTTNTFTEANVFTKSVGIGTASPGQLLQIGDVNTLGSQGMIRLGSRSPTNTNYRTWDIGVPQTGADTSGIGYSFVIDDTLLGTDPELVIRWGTGRVGIGRTNPATALDVNGTVTATGFAGNASGLTNLNASQLAAGTVPLAQLPGAVVTNNQTGVSLHGTFSGNAAGLTNLNASQLASGTVTDARLSANVALLNMNQTFSGSNRFAGVAILTNAANSLAGTFTGNGAGLTNLNAGQLTSGTLPLAQLPAAAVTNNATSVTLTGAFSGNGAGLTNLSATNLAGTLSDSRLSANVALLNTNQVFTGSNRFAGVLTLTNAGNTLVGTLSGDGAGVTNVNADQLDGQHGAYYQNAANLNAGTLSDSRLSANVALLNTSQAFTASNRFPGVVTLTNTANTIAGTFTGNGGGVTNVNLLSINDQGAIGWTTNWGTLFVWASSPAVGTAPWEVAAADVNSDGKLDLISANRTFSTLSVLTNNGIGGFVLSSSPVVGTSPQSVVAVDVNSDGKPDLISANTIANTLSVLTNNGTGAFILASSPGVGVGPYLVVAADVNSDGKPDLISVNSSANTLSVLINNGSGEFVLASSPAVGSGPQSVVAADVNSDGKVDLISANFSANTLTVLTNNGSGGFAVSSSPAAGAAPRSVAAGDVNGDGKQDLIIANQNASALTILTNNGSGGFVLSSSAAVGSTPVSVRAADVTGDGKVDLITANFLGNTLSVLINNGSGGFLPASSLGVGSGPASVTAADVNGDGKLDLISANNSANTLTILNNAPAYAATFQGAYIGNGGALTNLNATALTGTIADARLSANVALLNANQAFTGTNRFAGVVAATNAANTLAGTFTGTFTGNGGALTNLVFPTAAHYVFSYSTTTQAVVTAGTFQDITNNMDAQLSGWTHAANTASFTNGQSGLYLIQYDAEATTTTTASSTISLRAVVNGVEIAGSQATANANTANLVVLISKSFIASISSGSVLKFQLTGSSVNNRLISDTGTGTTRPSFSCTIMRLQ